MNANQKATLKVVAVFLDVCEEELRDIMLDEMDRAEEIAARQGSWAFDEILDDGQGIIYAENVNSDLDMAIHNVHEAWASLQEAIKNTES